MEENPLKSEMRRCGRENRLGEAACCVLCGESDSKALICVKRTLLEKHHVVGRAHDRSIWVNTCRNCHAKLTANALDAGAQMDVQPTVLERIAMILRALGSFLEAMAQAFYRYADDLLRLVAGLDKDRPDWRNVAEAR